MMLALKMGRTLDELFASMSSQEFSLWIEMYREDQLGEARQDERTGLLAATIANYAGKVRTDSQSLGPGDFFPGLVKAVEVQEEPDPVAFFTAVAASKSKKQKG
jgi:hypothetical protein